MMNFSGWNKRWRKLRPPHVETDLASYELLVAQIDQMGGRLCHATDAHLRRTAATLRQRTLAGAGLDELLPEMFALTREIAHRVIGQRPFGVQLMAGVGLHRGKLVELQTGEGKTLAAVLPAALHALTGRGVHLLTFNDYLAHRDATWMRPVYEALGLRVGVLQAGMGVSERKSAYAADVMYATGKEAGFDFLRAGLARSLGEIPQRPYNFAIVDEADSILIDEARAPLVIAGDREKSGADPYRIATIVEGLEENTDWAKDEHGRNVQLTNHGIDRVEALLACGSLHAVGNSSLLSEVNQALHARVMLKRDVDYIVREGHIALVDEFTGRVVADRRWPDGLQAALEAKEGLAIRPGGRILGSITLPHFLAHYPTLAGMTATGESAAAEFKSLYGLQVLRLPTHRPCVREDLPDHLFTHRQIKERAIVRAIAEMHEQGRPVLVGTGSVEESERLAEKLGQGGIPCRMLNAKNNESEAEIIAEAGAVGAVTISTNMAGRGTDIRLGGAGQKHREHVAALGGLFVIGTNRHESRRIDDQLRGRAGRQGDPGASRFFVSLEDPLLVRFGIDDLIPGKLRPLQPEAPLDHPMIHREVERLQRVVAGQNQEIRSTLARYSAVIERQRATLFDWRFAVLTGEVVTDVFATRATARYTELLKRVEPEKLREAERRVILHHVDTLWIDHLAFIAGVREGIHLVGIGGMDPLTEFQRLVAPAFRVMHQEIEDRTVRTLMGLELTNESLLESELRGPASTWTYLINDRAVTELQQLLHGPGAGGFAAAGVLMTWPLLLASAIWRKFSKQKSTGAGHRAANFHET
ncbi:MAG: accessory Sec system translocase SecA2 [Lacunisphaera sp.]